MQYTKLISPHQLFYACNVSEYCKRETLHPRYKVPQNYYNVILHLDLSSKICYGIPMEMVLLKQSYEEEYQISTGPGCTNMIVSDVHI